MRKPHQILAFPYKKENDIYMYAIFKRKNKDIWQAIAGGVEDDETYLEACKREASEEAGISYNTKVIELESVCTIPVVNVTKDFIWGEDICLVYEHCYGIDAQNENIKISQEHSEYKWCTYEQAKDLLKYDSNKNALWELNYKLTKNKYSLI